MSRRSIYMRWSVNVMGVVALIVLTMLLAAALAIHGYVYNGIESTLNASSLQLMNYFPSRISASEFIPMAREYIETFPNKQMMEVMIVNSKGEIVATSTGFTPDNSELRPDCEAALAAKDGYGNWTGNLSSGEKVMAITRVLRNSQGKVAGGIRYIVSLTGADKKVSSLITVASIIALIVIAIIVFSGVYFINTIIKPIREINDTAQRIAGGNLNVRVEKVREDEIGDLSDTLNDMAMKLSSSEKTKNDFISSISHELRTPLTAIKGWAETMQGGEVSEETMERGLGVISREAGRLSTMVEELLDFSRLEQGTIKLVKSRIDIIAEVGEAVYMFTERAASEEKYLLYEEPDLISPVYGDVDRLRQVFLNIIDNAIKYTEKGGTVSVNVSESPGFVHVVVSDNGCGISAENLPHVKEKFYKANHAVRGSGIGLAVADEIVSAHGGRLEIESHENVGTAVTISLPLAETAAEEPAVEKRSLPNDENKREVP